MSTPDAPKRGEAVQRVLRALLESFDSYHSDIREQTALAELLMESVEGEERRRCHAIAQRIAATATSDEARRTAEAIAENIREP